MAFLSCKTPYARLKGGTGGGPGICGGEPNRCNVIGGTSGWFEFHATDDATVMIDTRGSTFDRVLAQIRIDCSTGGQPGANWRRVSFQAQCNASYYVVADGANVNDRTGRAQLNWAMGQQPVIATAPQYELVRPGQRWRFSATRLTLRPPFIITERFFSSVPHAHLLGVRVQDTFIFMERSPSGMGEASATAWLRSWEGRGRCSPSHRGMRSRSILSIQRRSA